MNRQRTSFKPSKQSGFSMVELMISITVGLFMVAAVLVTYVSSTENFRLQEAMSEVQEEGRFAAIQMLRDFREAGFGMDDNVAGLEPTAAAVAAMNAKMKAQEPKANIDLLALSRIKSWVVYLPMSGDTGVSYYVASTTDNPDRWSLYRNRHQIAEGVEEFILEFGLDDNSDDIVDRYKHQYIMQTADWDNARSIRFTMVLSSTLINVVETPQKVYWPFRQVDTSDRRLYRTFVGTAVMRNAVL